MSASGSLWSVCRPVASTSTARTFVRHSHIGRAPISVPPAVTFTFDPSPPRPSTPTRLRRNRKLLRIDGPKGRVELELVACVRTTPALETLAAPRASEAVSLRLAVDSPEQRDQKALWGLTRQLVSNAVKGVTEGHETEINLVGVGYRVAVEPPAPSVPLGGGSSGRPVLNFKLGFSHPVVIPVPEGIDASTSGPTRLLLRGADKHALGPSISRARTTDRCRPARRDDPQMAQARAIPRQGHLRQRRNHQAEGDSQEMS